MLKDLANKHSKLLAAHYRGVWSGVVLMETITLLLVKAGCFRVTTYFR